MGGDRASTTRRREAGKICCFCKVPLPWDIATPHRERVCDKCTRSAKPTHRVLMSYQLARRGWYLFFLEADCKTSLRTHLAFQSTDKIVELARRGGASFARDDQQAMEYSFQIGRGALWLKLTGEQYRRLK